MNTTITNRSFFKAIQFVLFVTFLMCSSELLSQEPQTVSASESYDLPPDLKLSMKYSPNVDLEYRLAQINSVQSVQPLSFWERWEQEGLYQTDLSNAEIAAYYERMVSYYNSLSDSIKALYSLEEIAQIFIFDKDLKLSLLNY